jgi:hypothetical protein
MSPNIPKKLHMLSLWQGSEQVCHQTVLYVVIQNIILHYKLYCFVYDSQSLLVLQLSIFITSAANYHVAKSSVSARPQATRNSYHARRH